MTKISLEQMITELLHLEDALQCQGQRSKDFTIVLTQVRLSDETDDMMRKIYNETGPEWLSLE